MPGKIQLSLLDIVLSILVSIVIIVLAWLFYNNRSRKTRVSNTHLSENPTYIIGIHPIGNHLQLTIPESRIVLETAPRKIKRDDAVALAVMATCGIRLPGEAFENTQVHR